MKPTTKIILLGSAALAVWYVPTILAVLNTELSIISFAPTNIRESKIDALVGVRLKNNSKTKVRISWIKSDILLNGIKIAEFFQTRSFTLQGNAAQNFEVGFTIDANVVGTELWRQLISQNLLNSNIEISGTLNANYKTLPFNIVWTVKDIAQSV